MGDSELRAKIVEILYPEGLLEVGHSNIETMVRLAQNKQVDKIVALVKQAVDDALIDCR